MNLSRRQLLTGGLAAAAGLVPVPAPAAYRWTRTVGMIRTHTAKSPTKLVYNLYGTPGYSPTLASVIDNLKQPGAPNPTSKIPFNAALQLVTRPWFLGLGSPDPIGTPPPAKLVRQTTHRWLDSSKTGFHPLAPVQRVSVAKTPTGDSLERQWFRDRARKQTNKIYKALKRRPPSTVTPLTGGDDELSQGMQLLIGRTDTPTPSTVQLASAAWLATAHAEVGDTPPVALPFGSTLANDDYFPDPPNYATPTEMETIIEILFASAAAAEAAHIMGVGMTSLVLAAREGQAAGFGTVAVISARGLAGLLGLSMTLASLGAVVGVLAIVTARPNADGTWGFFCEFAPLSFNCGGCDEGTPGSVGVVTSAVIGMEAVAMTIGLSANAEPAGNITSDDGAAAPGDTGVADGGDF